MARILRAGKIITGTGEEKKDVEIRIEKKKITKIEEKVTKNSRDEIIDYTNKTLIPGLIDTHLHYALNGEAEYEKMFIKESVPHMAIKAVGYAKKDLEMGFTTVRDMGAPGGLAIALRDSINKGFINGPRILASGSALSITGGHGDWFPEWIKYEGGLAVKADGKEEVRKAVRRQIRKGADNIKVIASGGVMDPVSKPGASEYTLEELETAVKETKKRGLVTGAHVQGKQALKNAVKAGVDSIDHGIFLDEETAEMMIQSGTYLVPTLTPPHRIHEYGTEAGIPEHAMKKNDKVIKIHEKSFELALEKGVNISMGSDVGTPFNKHGENAFELELMVKHGMTEMVAISSATNEASKLLNISGKVGTLEEGKIADIVVLNKDPLENIRVLQEKKNIEAVYKKGKKINQS